MTVYSQVVIGLVAIGVAFWPQIRTAVGTAVAAFRDTGPAVKPLGDVVAPNYRDSIYHLAQVRLRLKTTGVLDDARKAAIDSLTLALVEGSDL
jgi:hypothetical protein